MKYLVFFLFFSLLSCGSSENAFNPNTSIQNDKDHLIGHWEMIGLTALTSSALEFEINDSTYIFYVSKEKTLERGYHLFENHIVSSAKPISNTRDSIPYKIISEDTLELKLKERGKPYKRTFYRTDQK